MWFLSLPQWFREGHSTQETSSTGSRVSSGTGDVAPQDLSWGSLHVLKAGRQRWPLCPLIAKALRCLELVGNPRSWSVLLGNSSLLLPGATFSPIPSPIALLASGTTVGRVRKKHSVGECLPGYRARAPAAETTKTEQGKCNAQASQHLLEGSSSSSARNLWPWELWSLNFLRRINEGKGNQQMLPDAGTRNAGEAESPLASAGLLSEVTCTFSPGPH